MRMKKRYRIPIILLSLTIVLLLAVIGGCLGVIVRLNRNNLFSKSIYTDNNYFLRDQPLSNSDTENIEQEGEIYSDTLIQKTLFRFKQALAKATDDEEASMLLEAWDQEIKQYGDAADLNFQDALMQAMQTTFEDAGGTYGFTGESTGEMSAYNVDAIIAPFAGKREIEEIIYYALDTYYTLGVCREADEQISTCVSDFLCIPFSFSSVESIQLNVPHLSQIDYNLPNGCEATAATMLLQYWGLDISPTQFVDDYLPCEQTSIRWGCRYGPNPKQCYAGDPRSENNGWGCFAPVIVTALNRCLPSGYIAKNVSGMSLASLQEQYLAHNIPVAVWVTVDMEEVDKIIQWQSNDGEESFLYPANEHCMVFTGCENDQYYFADPLKEEQTTAYASQDAVRAYNEMGMQAVVIVPTSTTGFTPKQ